MSALTPYLLAGVALLLSACGPGRYAQDFVERSRAQADPPATAEGAWVGQWESEVNGHRGPLWCLVDPHAERPGHYDFRYRAGWGALKFGDYTHTVATELTPQGELPLSGEMVLPGGFGVYQVDGRLTATEFHARYESRGDRGTMRLKRP